MLTKEDLKAIASIMDEKIKAEIQPLRKDFSELKADVTTIKEDLSIVKEDSAITREAVNTVLSWAERAETMVKVPLYEKAE